MASLEGSLYPQVPSTFWKRSQALPRRSHLPDSRMPTSSLTSHLPRRPVSCSRDQMLWILPACSGWLLVFPQVHWCFSISVSYTRPEQGRAAVRAVDSRPTLGTGAPHWPRKLPESAANPTS